MKGELFLDIVSIVRKYTHDPFRTSVTEYPHMQIFIH